MKQFYDNFMIGFHQGFDLFMSIIPMLYTVLLIFEAVMFYHDGKMFESMVMSSVAMIYIQVRKL